MDSKEVVLILTLCVPEVIDWKRQEQNLERHFTVLGLWKGI
jgi:hypothetical protein